MSAFVCSGIENLVILKSGDSEFKGYIKDQFTTLKESSDRVMAVRRGCLSCVLLQHRVCPSFIVYL